MHEHSLLKLIDVLRTFNDDHVTISSIKKLLNESITSEQLSDITTIIDSNTTDLESSSALFAASLTPSEDDNDWQINKNGKTVSITKQKIQSAIKIYYKQCQNFEFISNIHHTLSTMNNAIITITAIPKLRTQGTRWRPGARLKNTEKVCSIESIMINIFHFLDLKYLSLCRSVCHQWLYYASNPFSVYHIDTFYLRRLIQHFIWIKATPDMVTDEVWRVLSSKVVVEDIYIENVDNYEYYKNIALYNLNILNNCQSIFINTIHFDRSFLEPMNYHKIVYSHSDDSKNSTTDDGILDQNSNSNSNSSDHKLSVPVISENSIITKWGGLSKIRRLAVKVGMMTPHEQKNSTRIDWVTPKIVNWSCIAACDKQLEEVKFIMFKVEWQSIGIIKQLLSKLSYTFKYGHPSSNKDTILMDHIRNNYNCNYNYKYINIKNIEICLPAGQYCSQWFINWWEDIDPSRVESFKFAAINYNGDGQIKTKRSTDGLGSQSMTTCVATRKVVIANDAGYLVGKRRNDKRSFQPDEIKYHQISVFTVPLHIRLEKKILNNDELQVKRQKFSQISNDISIWNQLFMMRSRLIECNKVATDEDLKHKKDETFTLRKDKIIRSHIKANDINLVLEVGVDKGTKWFNVNLDLYKSQGLVNIVKLFHEWYINGNINAYLWFKVSHFVPTRMIVSHRYHRINGKTTTKISYDVTKENWIQLIVKTLRFIFLNEKCNRNNSDCLWPFDKNAKFPTSMQIVDSVELELFEPHIIKGKVNATTTVVLCVKLKHRSQSYT